MESGNALRGKSLCQLTNQLNVYSINCFFSGGGGGGGGGGGTVQVSLGVNSNIN